MDIKSTKTQFCRKKQQNLNVLCFKAYFMEFWLIKLLQIHYFCHLKCLPLLFIAPQMHVVFLCAVVSSSDGIELPQKILFPPERLTLKWNQVHRIGAGLQNMGNTCFLNSALQCLTYTPPLANHMLSREHSKTCKWLHLLWFIYHCWGDFGVLWGASYREDLWSSIRPCCRSRAGLLYDVHHAEPHHSGFCQLRQRH